MGKQYGFAVPDWVGLTAVEMVETDSAPDHTVLEEYQRGYNFKGRLLRPAMVKVAVAPASNEQD